MLAPQQNPRWESGEWILGCFTASVLANHRPALGLGKCSQNVYTTNYCVKEKELQQDMWILIFLTIKLIFLWRIISITVNTVLCTGKVCVM